jgi:hypothetical protein
MLIVLAKYEIFQWEWDARVASKGQQVGNS